MTGVGAVLRYWSGAGPALAPAARLAFLIAVVSVGLLRPTPAFSQTSEPAKTAGFSLAISAQLFADVNESDARAALKVWLKHMSDDRGIAGDPTVLVMSDPAGFIAAYESGRIEGATLPTVELWHVRKAVPLVPTVILGRIGATIHQELLLIVHRDEPFTRLEELKGRQLLVSGGSRGSLPEIWIEYELLKLGHGTNAGFWSRVVPAGKLTKVAYPVFFKQADVCIISAEGYRTLCELNPQMERQLKVIAKSPPLVPAPFCFFGNTTSPYVKRVIANVPYLNTVPTGRQALALFQTTELVVSPISELDETFRLIDQHQALLLAVTNSGNGDAR